MNCKMPRCEKVATKFWKLVPVCCHCWDDLQAEQQMYYAKRIAAEDRVLMAHINNISPTSKPTVGLTEHTAVARKVVKGIVTVYEIRGKRYVLDNKSKRKGAKV